MNHNKVSIENAVKDESCMKFMDDKGLLFTRDEEDPDTFYFHTEDKQLDETSSRDIVHWGIQYVYKLGK